MKRIIILAMLLLVGISSCRKEDVFALWRDKSNLVIKGEATTIVTVMQYNIWGADKGWNSQRFDRVAAIINSQKPDFVTMNEVDSMTTRNKYFMAKELAERTGMYYAFAVGREPGSGSHQLGNGAYGDAVLSKYPILETKRFKLLPDPRHTEEGKEDRTVCGVRVEVDGKDLWVAVTHLDHRNLELSRIYQANHLKAILDQMEGPLILGGDLNAKPDSETMKIIFDYMSPQYPSPSKEYYTFPSCYAGEEPWKLIDYILLRKDDRNLECLTYRIVNEPASDHCGVVATFKLKD